MSNKSRGKHNAFDLLAIAEQAMIKEGFQPDFSADIQNEVRQIETRQPSPMPETRDLRSLLWSSIDNVKSRDLDQVEYAERLPDDRVKLMVAIADVAAFVFQESAIDRRAAANSTSVYTGVTTFAMLPEELSTDKTSLLEAQDRLAIVIELAVAGDGSSQTTDIYPALVRNQAKLSYEVIGSWLDNNESVPPQVANVSQLEQQLRLQLEVAGNLRELRKEHGALELDTIQATPLTDEQGKVVDLEVAQRNSARDIIENFMIAANVAMAEFLQRHQVLSITRVVRTPENWSRIVEIASELNETLPSQPDARALAEFLERRRKADPVHFPDLSLGVVKLLGPGEYVVQVPGQTGEGHFGLAVHNYSHSTAPNRRYADLTTQRLLKSVSLKTQPPYTEDELRHIAEHCTERENAARKVERKMRKVAAAMLLKDRIGEQFSAVVTGVTPKGTFVRTLKPPVDGLVVRGKEGLKVGQQLPVKLLSTDPSNGFIDFAVTKK